MKHYSKRIPNFVRVEEFWMIKTGLWHYLLLRYVDLVVENVPDERWSIETSSCINPDKDFRNSNSSIATNDRIDLTHRYIVDKSIELGY